ncbi:transcriptional regulator [Pseudoroseomonas deserti]|uniref:Transcriptional regulator n=1 Tax=Teichococcus deserti TaxID=1817963 RepID=A0A1V2H1J8_9PROT|nr:winged helix-turn-helix transcriptional regulator [Pseudoroseomonas deserti]ONG52314.1 transcriptional regulator [Pseudoroseomonas deserti]
MKSEKLTDASARPRSRWYGDACATAHAMELLGERWSLLVMRELFFGPKRFSELRAGLPGLSATVLTQRLEGLEAAGILHRLRMPPPVSAQLYALTEWGLQSEPIFQALGRWAARSPSHDPTLAFSAASLMLSLGAMFDPARAEGLQARIGFRLAHEDFLVTIADGAIATRRAAIDGADLVLEGPPRLLAAAIYGGQPWAALEATGEVRLAGDRALAEKLATLFPLPDKAPG